MNPIEHLWPIVGRKLVGQTFSSRDALWQALVLAFGSITPAQVRRLYASMPSRLLALKQAKGGYTRY
jgi:transposase